MSVGAVYSAPDCMAAEVIGSSRAECAVLRCEGFVRPLLPALRLWRPLSSLWWTYSPSSNSSLSHNPKYDSNWVDLVQAALWHMGEGREIMLWKLSIILQCNWRLQVKWGAGPNVPFTVSVKIWFYTLFTSSLAWNSFIQHLPIGYTDTSLRVSVFNA